MCLVFLILLGGLKVMCEFIMKSKSRLFLSLIFLPFLLQNPVSASGPLSQDIEKTPEVVQKGGRASRAFIDLSGMFSPIVTSGRRS